ncbi:MAG: GGDEF domain-containing protein [Synechococcaceae cyanobacterium]|nr:GGDEF domain-containing protein [Synechococcaceae cyanobacterium]
MSRQRDGDAGSDADPIEARLRGLSDGDLELRFQPILLVSAPGRIALEVLVRFRPPELAALGTQAVMDRAHDLGLAQRVDRLVLQRLEAVQRAWRQLGDLSARIPYITVNISGASVATAARQDELIALLRAQRVDPGLFRLELTETDAVELVEAERSLASAAQRLMEELGIRLLVDDFGSGLSNYRRLCEAWYDAIKLDLQLVQGIAGSFRLQTFVGSLIEAVHGLGRTVVAEGVEQHRDLEVLLRLGVDGLQGFLIATPLAWSELAGFLEESPWLDPACMPALQARIIEADRQLQAPLAPVVAPSPASVPQPVPLERHILEHWSSLRGFEEVVLLFVQQLRGWGLDVLRFSLAFLPDQEEVDCSQYVWYRHRPGEVESLRMQRDFLETPQHLESVLHHIATRAGAYRVPLADGGATGFAFLDEMHQRGGSDYLGLRLASRGVSIPVLTVCLMGTSRFSDQQVERIETMSSLLSLLFHAFECERASRLSLLDPLTQLPNRRSFDSRIRAEAVAAATASAPLAVLLVDIDRFKAVNDSLGHAYGDTCLSRVAALLQEQLQRQSDMVARLGGEEFGVVLAHTDAAHAIAIAERLRRAVAVAALEHPAPINGCGLTISLGLACWDPDGEVPVDIDRLLQLADDCLYAAKRQGRDRVVAADLTAGED